MRLKTLLFFFAFFGAFAVGAVPSWAQTGQITGTVTDDANGEPLPGVNVVIVGTQQGASTDADGAYTITGIEPGTYDVRASFVGYEQSIARDVSVSAGETTQVNFALVQTAVQLENVVAVGYGTRSEEEVTGSLSSVDSEDFIQGATRGVGEMIENQVAGLNFSQPSGDPRSGSEVNLRGVSTLKASSSPLILIDGVPGNLDTVSPQDIESVDVLKGGAAAAIYGSRATNGVILITTKSASAERPTRIEYSGTVSTQQIKRRQNFMTADEIRKAKEEVGSRIPELPINSLEDYGANTDWRDVVMRDNPVSTVHDIAVSGGNVSTNYRASLRYENRDGLMERSYNEKVIGRVNVDHSMFEGALRADLNLLAQTENNQNGQFNRVYRQAIPRNPTDRIRDDEGNYIERPLPNYRNPVALLNERNGLNKNRKMRLNGRVVLNPLEGLELSLLGAANRTTGVSEFSETFQHPSTTIDGVDGTAQKSNSSDEELLLEFTGTYDAQIANHDFEVLGGYTWQENFFEWFQAYNENFPSDEFGSDNLGLGQALTEGRANMGSGSESDKLISFFGRTNYNYDNRYILTASLRYEGSSKFGADHKWGAFPSLSVGWRIGQESFMEEVAFIDRLKLRAGFGITGTAPADPYQSLASFQYSGKFFNDGEWVPGLEPARNPNPDLKWERKEEFNIGLDFTAFSQHLNGSVDVYRRTTHDLLWDYNVPVPPFVFPTITANVGTMRNEGVETSLEFEVIQTDNAEWSTQASFSTNRNRLLSLSNDRFEIEDDAFNTGFIGVNLQLPSHRVEVGEPIGNFFGFKVVGVNEDGIFIYESAEGEEIPQDERELKDRRVIGNGAPNFRIGWNHSFRLGNFDARIVMGGEFGFQIANKAKLYYGFPMFNDRNWLESAFEPRDGKILRSRKDYVDDFVEDGDYWKVESVTLGYRISPLVKADYISNARVYVTGRNLLTFTGYSGVDPEVSTTGLTPGFDEIFKYPTTRRFTLGVNLTF